MNRRLTRSRDGMIGGVAGGVATLLDADPALIRIAWALLVPLTGGVALLAYVVAWVVVPEASKGAEEGEPARPAASQRDDGRITLIVGGGLILVGVWFLLRELVPSINWSLAWPVVLIGIGALILVGSTRRSP